MATENPIPRSISSAVGDLGTNTSDKKEIYRARMNLETSRIAWSELQRFFASGAAIYVSPSLDLVEVAYQISEDNKETVLTWVGTGQVAKVSDEQALTWYEANAIVWAVVVSPWVLVQARD